MDESAPSVVSDSIRYQGKAVDDPEWITDFLADQKTGVVGLVDDGAPHLVTQLFVYDDEEGAIFVHGARDGRAYGIVESEEETAGEGAAGNATAGEAATEEKTAGEATTEACFTTSEMGRFVPAEEPVNFTVEYASVVAYGTIGLLDGRAEKQAVLEQFMQKFAPQLTVGEDYEEMTDESIDRTAVYRLDVDEWSAKEGMKDPDHPDAYDLDAVRESS